MPTVDEFCCEKKKSGPAKASRLLFKWLSDDKCRNELYADMVARKRVLEFESRAMVEHAQGCHDDNGPKTFRQRAYLVVHPEHVKAAYQTSGACPVQWSHTPYKDLGGTFMLALDEDLKQSEDKHRDPFLSHDLQRSYCFGLLKRLDASLDAIATVAFKAGAGLALKQRRFDLADLAETVAVNYVCRLFGFSQADLGMLKAAGTAIGNGLMHVNVGQHFITDALAVPQAKAALAKLSSRCAELIDLYDQPVGNEQQDRRADLNEELRQLRDFRFEDPHNRKLEKRQLLKEVDFRPLLQLMAERDPHPPQFSTTEKAVMAAGLVSGTITNLRAAVCIAISQFFQLDAPDAEVVKEAARLARLEHQDASYCGTDAAGFRAFVEEALRRNPPPPFVPRRTTEDISLCGGQELKKDSAIVLAVGGGSWVEQNTQNVFRMEVLPSVRNPSPACPFSRVFGGDPDQVVAKTGRAEYLHSCIGKDMAMHSVLYTVRQLMLLPGLTQSRDDLTGEVLGLTKRAGFICERYPLEYEREKLLRQSPLQTVLHIKNPVPENAAALRQVLQFGAPFIEKVLREARHVHFASFMFLDNDSKLVLFTAYDGDFDGYIGHFAREFGPLFDRFFSHIDNAPPMPIAKHPFEFVQFLRRFQQPAVGGLFFSAYPDVQVDQIVSIFNKDRDFDFFTMEGGR